MGKIPFDHSYERGGRHLPEWLFDLVSPEREVRIAAGEALGGMWMGYPSFSTKATDMDYESVIGLESYRRYVEHLENFSVEVRKAVDTHGFPNVDFVQHLCLFLIALSEDNTRVSDQLAIDDEKHDSYENRLINKMVIADSEPERNQAEARFEKLSCSKIARRNRIFASSEIQKLLG